MTPSEPGARSGSSYAETLRPPVSWWLGGLAFCVAVWWAVFVATTALVAGCAAGFAAAVVVTWLLRYGGARIEVTDAGLRAGRAVLPWRYVGAVTACDAAETRRLLGAGADARAYLVTRPYIPGAVRVAVNDERDPAPYWLICTRRPELLAGRLSARCVRD